MQQDTRLDSGVGAVPFLERDRELEAVRRWLMDLSGQHGRLALVVAGAGLGKTTLLQRAAALGRSEGLRVLWARGGELEREMSFGVARQLFEAEIRAMPIAEQRLVLAGAAARARALLGFAGGPGGAGDPLGVIHGLYWLAVNLADRRPLLLVVDDVHWADAQTLRWLNYLAARIGDAGILVLAAARAADPPADALLNSLSTAEHSSIVGLEPLGADAVAELVRAQFGCPGEAAFVTACAKATGGNPFYLRELLRAAAGDGIKPTEGQAPAVAQLGSPEVARSILVRLARAGGSARRLASAIAILGSDSELHRAASVSGLATDEALRAWDVLARSEILQPTQPLEFIHPIARTAVYRELGTGERSRKHREAAALLDDDRAAPQTIAVQALACEPAADQQVVAWLRAAAADALNAGAPDAAARYLQRALKEPPAPELRGQMHSDLGRALVGVDSAQAAVNFAKAADSANRSVRLLAYRWQAHALGYAGQMDDAMATYDRAIALAGHDTERVLHLTGTREFYAAWWANAPNRAGRRQRLHELATDLNGDTPGERQMLAALATTVAHAGSAPASRALALIERLSRVVLSWSDIEGAETRGAVRFVKIACDDPDAIALFEENAIPDLSSQGRIVDLAFAQANLATAKFRHGALVEAEGIARTSWEIMRSVGEAAATVYWWAASALIEILIARGELDEAAALFEATGLGVEPLEVVTFPWPPVLRGQLALAQGRTDEGVEIVLRAGAWLEQHGFTNPSYIPWRSDVAAALAALGRREDAREVIEPAVRRARQFGAPWALGASLRAAGTAEQGHRGIELLHQAVAILKPSECRLEHAHALLELGTALRRANARSASREPLRAALEMAHRCGAAPLANRAEQELAATGARPRRVVLSGVDSLTASERRVAELAATGLSNREIAQQLFVTQKTIESHLSHVYLKLDVKSRKELPYALSGQAAEQPSPR